MQRRLPPGITSSFSDGRLKIRVIKGNNLVKSDITTHSDPYVVVTMGQEKRKTRVVTDDCNPIWNEELSPLYVKDLSIPIILTVYDYDSFTKHDKIGDAELDIMSLQSLQSGRTDSKLIEDLTLKLRNVKHGELDIQIEWTGPKARSLTY